MLTITLSALRSLHPCVPHFDAAMASLGRMPAEDEAVPLVAALDAGVPLADLLWVVARIDRPILVAFAADCASVAVDDRERSLALRYPNEHGADATFAAARTCIAATRGGDPGEIGRARAAAYAAYGYTYAAYAAYTYACAYAAYAVYAYAAAAARAATEAAAAYAYDAAYDAAAAAYAYDAYAYDAAAQQTDRGGRRAWCLARLREYLSGGRLVGVPRGEEHGPRG